MCLIRERNQKSLLILNSFTYENETCLKGECFPPLGRREALEERVDVKYFLLWIHHQGSGRCPYKNSAHTCEHSNTPAERWHFHRLVWVYSEPEVF